MRKNIFLIICLISGPIFAQTEKYFPVGTTWEEEEYAGDEWNDGSSPKSAYFRYTVSRDTVIEGQTYKCVDVEKRVTDGGDPNLFFS